MTGNGEIPDINVAAVNDAAHAAEECAIVDVRTDIEWSQVGIPDLHEYNNRLFLISWQVAPDMRVNGQFIEQLEAAGVRKDVPVYFLCRSGVRSRAAAEAATAAGFGPCFNIAEGFEGVAGPDGIRHGGWQGNGLPETKPTSAR